MTAIVVDAVLIVKRAAVVWDAVLRDVDGRIAVVVLDPVDDAPQAPRYNVQPFRGTSEKSTIQKYYINIYLYTKDLNDRIFI